MAFCSMTAQSYTEGGGGATRGHRLSPAGAGRYHCNVRRERNVLLLAAGQALGGSGIAMTVFAGGLVGAELAPAAGLTTLPVTLMVIGVAAGSAPAALLMRRIGRRAGFSAASLAAAGAAALAAAGIARGSFALFCAAMVLIGGNAAFIAQYRFAAAESVAAGQVDRAVSFILVGGIVSGLLGPQLGAAARDWSAAGAFAGSFLALAGVYLVTAGLLRMLERTEPARLQEVGEERPLRVIARRPAFRLALLAGAVSFGVMSFLMTAAPVSMHHLDRHSLAATSVVIQAHIVAMYAPSLLAGLLFPRLGLLRVMGLGALALLGSVAAGLCGRSLPLYLASMILLGVGWNFLFSSGTALLTRSYLPAERFKVQAANDSAIFGFQSIASLSAGLVLLRAGWATMNLLALPVVALMLAALLGSRRAIAGSAGG